ncbi:MAG: hypothetical protein ACHQ9S_21010 [Candidatus Binatia bacterium]
MTLEDDVRKCCNDIESVRNDTERLKKTCGEEAKKDLSSVEAKMDRFGSEAKAVRSKLDAGVREGLEGLISAWRDARNRVRAHLRLIEAKTALASARRLAADQYYVAAENELTVTLQHVTEARALLPSDDARVAELVEDIQRAVADIHVKADTTAATLEKVFACNERLLAELAQGA